MRKEISLKKNRIMPTYSGVTFYPNTASDYILFLLFWDVLWIINDLLAPSSSIGFFSHEFQQNSQFLRTISNDLDWVAYNHEISSTFSLKIILQQFPSLSAICDRSMVFSEYSSTGRSIFFKGVHLEYEKKTYSYNSFYRLFIPIFLR